MLVTDLFSYKYLIPYEYKQKFQQLHFQNTTIGACAMALTKAKIVEAVVKQNGYTSKRSVEIIETLLEIIKSSLESGEDVLVSGFGKFCVHEKKARKGRNPATGEMMMLAPRKIITFRCSRQLRNKING